LDEPTRGLDEASIEVFKNKINSLIIEKKCAVIITSHDYVEGLNYTNFYQLENGVLNEV
jgi:ABC-type multidrug transport system ATPase subunit